MTSCPICKKPIQCGPPPTLHNQRFKIIRKLIKLPWDKYFETCTKEQKKELKKKIKDRSTELKIPQRDILTLLNKKENQLLRRYLIIDPIHQQFHENKSASYIAEKLNELLPESEEKFTTKNVMLNKRGKNSLHVKYGRVISNEKNDSLDEPPRLDSKHKSYAKSIDFTFKIFGKTFVITHKFTKDPGGGQKDFSEDIRRFMLEAKPSKLKTTIFLAIMDGSFNERKRKELILEQNGKNTFAIGIELLPHFLEHYKT